MSENQKERLETLIHDVNSKCASLRADVALLKTTPLNEAREILELMGQQAQTLAQGIESYAKELSD